MYSFLAVILQKRKKNYVHKTQNIASKKQKRFKYKIQVYTSSKYFIFN